MEIFINDSKIEFQLENEKNLREVIDSINDWLFNDNKVIDEIIINDKLFSGRIEELEDYKIKEVKTVKLTAININVLVQSSLLETKRYLLDIYDILQEKKEINKEDIDKLYTGLEWVINVIQRSDNLYKYGEKIDKDMFDFLTHLSSLKEAKEFLGALMRKNDINEARNFIKSNLINIIDLWSKKIDILIDNSTGEIGSMQSARTKVSTQIYKIINKIPDMLRMIKVITTDLRTGNEKQAMDSIQIIISTMESIISLLQLIKTSFNLDYKMITIEDKTIEEYNLELNGILKEIVEAMETGDTVLISDLIEYELAPRLEKYIEVLKLISKEINIEVN